MPLTLYAVSDGPPSLAVMMALKALDLEFNHINVDFGLGEHMTEEFEKVNINLVSVFTHFFYKFTKIKEKLLIMNKRCRNKPGQRDV